MRYLSHNLQYRYLVETKHTTNSKSWSLCCFDDNILWISNTYRKSKRNNPFIFPTKQLAQKAIKDSIKYADKHNYPWTREYRIIPVLLDTYI